MKKKYLSPEADAIQVLAGISFLFSTGSSSGTNLGDPSDLSGGNYEDIFG